mmetsp:Transcript_45020/g.97775  ORF Transcript_45020/g.97775 Transcript_45020/m.97775 type:complete len:173 (-) Transcript_45020:20-538(-)
MKALCKPLRCLSFLGGRSRPAEYSSVDSQRDRAVDDDDEDDFFGDSWEEKGNSLPSSAQAEEVQAQGVERNPTRETTTKRSTAATGSTASSAPAAGGPERAGPTPKKDDFFNQLGMEPEYRAPRTRQVNAGGAGSAQSAPSAERQLSAMLEEEALDSGEAGGWGDEDLDLKL